MYPPYLGVHAGVLKSADFGMGCLGLPSNPELRKVPKCYLPAQAQQEEGKGLEGLAESPGASCRVPAFPSSWVCRGRLLPHPQWAQRRLEVSLPAKAGRAGAGGIHGGRKLKAKVWLPGCTIRPGKRGAGPGGTGFPRLLGAAALGMAAQGPLCGGTQLLRRAKAANNSAMLPPAGPGFPGYTTAAEGEETGWRFFIVTNIKSGLSPLSLAPYPNADRKQINL